VAHWPGGRGIGGGTGAGGLRVVRRWRWPAAGASQHRPLRRADRRRDDGGGVRRGRDHGALGLLQHGQPLRRDEDRHDTVAELAAPGYIEKITVLEGCGGKDDALLSMGGKGIGVVDVSNPAAPACLRTMTVEYQPLSDACSDGGGTVFTEPAATAPLGGGAVGTAIDHGRIDVPAGAGGLTVVKSACARGQDRPGTCPAFFIGGRRGPSAGMRVSGPARRRCRATACRRPTRSRRCA
jgi:hypothetical protein